MSHPEIRKSFRAGCEIFSEGSRGDCAYIIEKGVVEISTRRAGEKLVLAHRRDGEIFGEMAIVDDEPRSATVTAVEDCKLLVLSREQLHNRLRLLDPVMRMVLGVVLQRFRDSMRWMRSETRRSDAAALGSTCDASELIDAHREAIERIELEQSLKHAIAEGELTLFYQPIVDAGSGRTVAFEGLARWRHPQKGLLAPGAFIAVAEESGLIRRISEWAVREACRGVAAMRAAGLSISSVSVNVSAQDLCDPDFFDHVRATLAAERVDPGSIALEVTETMLMSTPAMALEMLVRYRDLGVSISIDDFGVGYSSLAYLARYPLQTLKIDKGFVDELESSEASVNVIEVMIKLAEVLGLQTVAEGIETEGQAEILRRLGCGRLQGFHFSRPLPLETHLERFRQTQPAA